MKENGIIVEDIFRMHYNAHLNYWGVYGHHIFKIHIKNKTVVIIYKYLFARKEYILQSRFGSCPKEEISLSKIFNCTLCLQGS